MVHVEKLERVGVVIGDFVDGDFNGRKGGGG
jgi:hypothetical protein